MGNHCPLPGTAAYTGCNPDMQKFITNLLNDQKELFESKKELVKEPRRIIRLICANDISYDVDTENCKMKALRFEQDEPGGSNFTLTINQLESIILAHFKGLNETEYVKTKILSLLKQGAEVNLPDFLDWLAERMQYVYNESPNIDFIHTCRDRAKMCRKLIQELEGVNNNGVVEN
jgi:hypothetical protein